MVTVHKELDKSVEKYFVSGGFAFVHPDSTADICAVRGAAGGGNLFCRRVAATGKPSTAAAWAAQPGLPSLGWWIGEADATAAKMCAGGKQICELYLPTGLGNCTLNRALPHSHPLQVEAVKVSDLDAEAVRAGLQVRQAPALAAGQRGC